MKFTLFLAAFATAYLVSAVPVDDASSLDTPEAPDAAVPTAYALCQTACNEVAVACYQNADEVFGTIVSEEASPAVLKCNDDLGSCASACPSDTSDTSTP